MCTELADGARAEALELYYHNNACNIPLYLHITMAAARDPGREPGQHRAS